ncbi:MAG: glycosyltransferase family 9 protein [Ferruginibacter sp.]
MQPPKKILIRLPNWLGDMVMSTSFVKALAIQFPGATIDLIAKKGIDFLAAYFPPHHQVFIFDKSVHKGIKGAWQFGRSIRRQKEYDLFFCLPDSFSSALIAKATGAKKTIGFKKELRSVLLSHSYTKPGNLHRVEEYINLLSQFLKTQIDVPPVQLLHGRYEKKKGVVININSEASSRRLPVVKAISIIDSIRKNITEEIILVGSPKEKNFVEEVYNSLADKTGIFNIAGQTALPELLNVFAENLLLLTTDSGPAHVANALGTPTIVLFGAGNEFNTAPYNKVNSSIIRLGKLPCEPCLSNTCKLYGVPECLLQLDESLITQKVKNILNSIK